MAPIRYFSVESFDALFQIVYKNYAHHETAPNYPLEILGIEKLKGVMEGAKMDKFYPTVHDKAAYILIQINKGHFFSNGNKRVALVFALFFVLVNEKNIKTLSREEYGKKLTELFPRCTNYRDFEDFLPEEFGYYNLSIIIADDEKYVDSFDELKEGVKKFLDFSVE